MDKFKFLKPMWFVMHIITIAFMFWLGHIVKFQ